MGHNRMFVGMKVEDPGPIVSPGIGVNAADLSRLMDKIDRLIDALGGINAAPPEQDNMGEEIKTGLAALFTPVYKRGNSVQGPLSVILDTAGRPVVDVWVRSTAVTTFLISGSVDGTYYRLATSVTLAQPGEAHIGYSNAYRYIKVETDPTKLNNADNAIEIVATR